MRKCRGAFGHLEAPPTPASAEETSLQCDGSPDLCWAVSFGAKYHQGADDCEAGYRHPLAPYRFQIVLALEIAAPLRPTNCTVGNSPADPRDEHRQPVVGSAENPWRASQARHRDRPDQRRRVYGEIFVRRVRSIGIRDRPTSFRSPWQNAYAERLIGSIRRECIDHIVIFGERHLRHVLLSYMNYYNATHTHLSLNKDAPVPRGVEWAGNIVCRPILGGLHHQYGRM